MDLKLGDVVELKSGGPKMTIADIGEFLTMELGAKCVWFDGKKRLEDVFRLETLQKSSGGQGIGISVPNPR